MAHQLAVWLHNTNRLGGPQGFRVEDNMRGSPQVGQLAK